MIANFSEVYKLKEVLLHRPGDELSYITPSMMTELLFDDTPFLPIAQLEHQEFEKILKNQGVKVTLVKDLMINTLEKVSKSIKNQFITQFIKEAGVSDKYIFEALVEYLESLNNNTLINKLISGITVEELSLNKYSLPILKLQNMMFILDPMPNLLYVRDHFATIGNGVAISSMYSKTRRRETIFSEYLFKHNYTEVTKYYDRYSPEFIEGGDILVVNDKVLAVASSQRTSANAISMLAKNIFNCDNSFEKILVLEIPPLRKCMHLDTVLTQIDLNTFIVADNVDISEKSYTLVKDNSHLKYKVEETINNLNYVLSKLTNQSINIIKCGAGQKIASEVEQWNDGANLLAIAPKKVIAYNRNPVTNQLLRDMGVEVFEIPSSELSRGRGGPRCMSMPLVREKNTNL